SGATTNAGAISALLLLKWVGTGAIVGSVVAAAVATVTTPGLIFSKHAVPVAGDQAVVVTVAPPRAPAELGRPTANAPAVAPDRARYEASKHVLPPAPERDQRPAAAAGVSDDQAAAASPPVPAPLHAQEGSSVVAEVASLDRARAALASGDAREALARLSA